ncbi:carbohydrate-binding family 9-like protein [Polaribacter sp. Z014]|uniref:carbohydrate-binding family 9-like protein n=1 Tax=Polaribacter sp. Z014 TaxID=2927126 RepID=UPI00201FC1FD|nr:carbohydrate-binding family 9-like protein [Polaribacter sp. Z014]MCL7762494.1 carbohydrate-binding family 9-like protein [Polaribacter sp. Z014]
MKNFKAYGIIFCLFIMIFVVITRCQKAIPEPPIFKVSKTNEPIIIDGKMDEAIWSKTESRTFDFTYNDEKPSDKQKTTLRMLWDENNLYLFYELEDKYLNARETERDGAPYFDDCAEIFIIPTSESLDTHFCFEINLFKAVNDLLYFNDYYQGTNTALKTFNPDHQVEVVYNGTVNNNSDIDKGWTMELKIPLTTFGFLSKFEPVQEGNKWRFLAIRQERNEAEGERRITSTIFPIYDISKDVHQPDKFGLMEFVN